MTYFILSHSTSCLKFSDQLCLVYLFVYCVGNIDIFCYIENGEICSKYRIIATKNLTDVCCHDKQRFVCDLVSYFAERSVEHTVLHSCHCRWYSQWHIRGAATAATGYGCCPLITVHRESTAGLSLSHRQQ